VQDLGILCVHVTIIEMYTQTLPWTDAELEIASCMRTCPYCGDQFTSAGNLRGHLKRPQYRDRNITVKAEKAGHRFRSPGWSIHNLFSATFNTLYKIDSTIAKDRYVLPVTYSQRVNQVYGGQVLKAGIFAHPIYTS
jgi:hypothetical protein